MAEQKAAGAPPRRRLKVIKPGMDTNEVIARFEAERQTLALMDHPNIAKVLDAGTTGAGSAFRRSIRTRSRLPNAERRPVAPISSWNWFAASP